MPSRPSSPPTRKRLAQAPCGPLLRRTRENTIPAVVVSGASLRDPTRPRPFPETGKVGASLVGSPARIRRLSRARGYRTRAPVLILQEQVRHGGTGFQPPRYPEDGRRASPRRALPDDGGACRPEGSGGGLAPMALSPSARAERWYAGGVPASGICTSRERAGAGSDRVLSKLGRSHFRESSAISRGALAVDRRARKLSAGSECGHERPVRGRLTGARGTPTASTFGEQMEPEKSKPHRSGASRGDARSVDLGSGSSITRASRTRSARATDGSTRSSRSRRASMLQHRIDGPPTVVPEDSGETGCSARSRASSGGSSTSRRGSSILRECLISTSSFALHPSSREWMSLALEQFDAFDHDAVTMNLVSFFRTGRSFDVLHFVRALVLHSGSSRPGRRSREKKDRSPDLRATLSSSPGVWEWLNSMRVRGDEEKASQANSPVRRRKPATKHRFPRRSASGASEHPTGSSLPGSPATPAGRASSVPPPIPPGPAE